MLIITAIVQERPLSFLFFLLLCDSFFNYLLSRLSAEVVGFLRQERQRKAGQNESDLRQPREHLWDLLYLVRVSGEEVLRILANLNLDVWVVVVRIDYVQSYCTCHDGIETEAHENEASHEVALRGEVAPCAKKRNKVNYTETNSA